MHQINRDINSPAQNATTAPAISLPEIVPSDGELLLRFTRGEQAAFAQLVDRHRRVVWLACWQVLRHRQDVEDTFQATFLILARKASSLRTIESLAAWLHRVAYRAAIRMSRNRKRDPASHLSTDAEMVEDKLLQIQRREESSILLEELRSLPDKYQVPLILCYLEGRTRSAAAEEMGCTTATVKGRLARGKSMLRIRLARRGVGFSLALAALATPLQQAEASLASSLMTEILDGCQAIQLGKPMPDSFSTQAVNLSQQTFVQQGLLTMTAASLAKPICIGMTLLGLATVALAEADKKSDGATSAVVSSNDAVFELVDASEKSAEVVEVEFRTEPNPAIRSTRAARASQFVKPPAVVALPELPELGVEISEVVVSELDLKSGPDVSTLSLQLREELPVVAQATAKAASRVKPKSPKANAAHINALQDAKKSLQLKSEGLEMQAAAKDAQVEALQADNENVRKELLDKATILELRAEAKLLKAEALLTSSKVVDIDRQIELFSTSSRAELPAAPVQPVAPVRPIAPSSFSRPSLPAIRSSRLENSHPSPEDVARIPLSEKAMELIKQEERLREHSAKLSQQREKQARAAEQMKLAHAEQRDALKQAEAELKQQIQELFEQHQKLIERQQEMREAAHK